MRTKDDINFVSDSDSFCSNLVLSVHGLEAISLAGRQFPPQRRREALQRLPRKRVVQTGPNRNAANSRGAIHVEDIGRPGDVHPKSLP